VRVINTADSSVTTSIPDGDTPHCVAITPNGAFAYVDNYYGSVLVIDTATNDVTTLTATATGMNDPTGMAVSPDGAYVYFSTNGPVTVMSTASNTVVTTVDIAIQSSTSDIAITPDGAYAYITDENAGGVHVIPTISPPFVAPEYIFGALLSLVACCAAFIAFAAIKKKPKHTALDKQIH
jgi:DNA-binding beta-propeller fold protein YncE